MPQQTRNKAEDHWHRAGLGLGMSTPLLLQDVCVGGGYSPRHFRVVHGLCQPAGCVGLGRNFLPFDVLGWVVVLSKLQKLKLFTVINLVSQVLVNLLDEYSSNKIRG